MFDECFRSAYRGAAPGRRVFRYCLLLLTVMPLNGLALDDCGGQARTPYENVYCEIKARGEGQGLPSLDDFRRNDTNIQALLLKRPAERLGISLPRNKPAKAPPPPARVKEPRKPVTPPPPPPRAVTRAAPKPRPETAPLPKRASCELLGERIRCAGNVYELALNRQNRALSPDALTAGNRLGLSSYRGDPGDTGALKRYLSDSYRRYIEKMLAIGLGGATMSFSKFYYTYQEVAGKGENFAERFETMYSYLKKDKAGMAVKSRYSEALPDSIDQCSELTDRLVVCDDAGTNWVYVRDSF